MRLCVYAHNKVQHDSPTLHRQCDADRHRRGRARARLQRAGQPVAAQCARGRRRPVGGRGRGPHDAAAAARQPPGLRGPGRGAGLRARRRGLPRVCRRARGRAARRHPPARAGGRRSAAERPGPAARVRAAAGRPARAARAPGATPARDVGAAPGRRVAAPRAEPQGHHRLSQPQHLQPARLAGQTRRRRDPQLHPPGRARRGPGAA